MLLVWRRMMSYSRGDVVLVAFPNIDMISFKKRPALIVQSDNLQTTYGDKLVACITSNLQKTGSTRVQIQRNSPEWNQMGLTCDSVIVVDNITTVNNQSITSKIGDCRNTRVQQLIDNALREIFDI